MKLFYSLFYLETTDCIACSKRSDSGERRELGKVSEKTRRDWENSVHFPVSFSLSVLRAVALFFAPFPTIRTPGTGYSDCKTSDTKDICNFFLIFSFHDLIHDIYEQSTSVWYIQIPRPQADYPDCSRQRDITTRYLISYIDCNGCSRLDSSVREKWSVKYRILHLSIPNCDIM